MKTAMKLSRDTVRRLDSKTNDPSQPKKPDPKAPPDPTVGPGCS